MKPDGPPRLAAALLRRLAPGEEALAGDLDEGYRSGRSQGWYWWQTGAAIAVTTWRDLQHERIAALGAIAVAAAVYLALMFSGAEIANDLTRAVAPHLPSWTFDYSVYQTCVGVLWIGIASWAVGVLVMALNHKHGTTALVALFLLVTLVEYPRWTLLPLLSGPVGPAGQIIVVQTAATVVKIVGLVAGALTFPERPDGLVSHRPRGGA